MARNVGNELPLPENGDFDDEDSGESNDGSDPSKTIVIHLGSQNMRIGLASDALPRTIPMCTAWKMPNSESEVKPPLPKRQKLDESPESMFGEEWSKKYIQMCEDLKKDMRANKRKVLPNSKELVVNYNRRVPPEKIPEHNDPVRVEWTDTSSGQTFFGMEAQRIPDESEPRYRIFWPIQHGRLNEADFPSRESLKMAIDQIIAGSLTSEYGLTKYTQFRDYSCVFVIPDLYDKKYVEMMLEMLIKDYSFVRVSFIQESLAASFGAGYTSACIVDIGAQKTSICCVEDGLCIEESRINLKYGGYDVTDTFIKMMLHDHFPYSDINLMRRYDFLLAEELKQNFCTYNQADISVQLYNFHLRVPNEYTRKYSFKTYDEVILAPMGFYDPSIFDNATKLDGRRKLIDRSYNAYDPDVPDDPMSTAQVSILAAIKPSAAAVAKPAAAPIEPSSFSTPAKEKPNPFNYLNRLEGDVQGTPGTSQAGSPAPEGNSTPIPNNGSPAPFQFGAGNGNGAPAGMFVPDAHQASLRNLAIERDSVLPLAPLDTAILTSINCAARGDEKKLRDLLGGIMVIGGGAKTPGFGPTLEDRLKKLRPDLSDRILVGTSPREMDGQVVTWKGASVFAKLVGTNDTWIGKPEWERLGSRVLYHKLAFYY
jgi:actin-related protein 8